MKSVASRRRKRGRTKREVNSPDGHDEDQHYDGDLNHPVATDASVVVKGATLILTLTRRRSTPTTATSLSPLMMLMTLMTTTVGTWITLTLAPFSLTGFTWVQRWQSGLRAV